jgi:hypothetical protein
VFKTQEPLVWDQEAINRLKSLENKWTRAIDLWFKQVKQGYIVEFVVEYNEYFSSAY